MKSMDQIVSTDEELQSTKNSSSSSRKSPYSVSSEIISNLKNLAEKLQNEQASMTRDLELAERICLCFCFALHRWKPLLADDAASEVDIVGKEDLTKEEDNKLDVDKAAAPPQVAEDRKKILEGLLRYGQLFEEFERLLLHSISDPVKMETQKEEIKVGRVEIEKRKRVILEKSLEPSNHKELLEEVKQLRLDIEEPIHKKRMEIKRAERNLQKNQKNLEKKKNQMKKK